MSETSLTLRATGYSVKLSTPTLLQAGRLQGSLSSETGMIASAQSHRLHMASSSVLCLNSYATFLHCGPLVVNTPFWPRRLPPFLCGIHRQHTMKLQAMHLFADIPDTQSPIGTSTCLQVLCRVVSRPQPKTIARAAAPKATAAFMYSNAAKALKWPILSMQHI